MDHFQLRWFLNLNVNYLKHDSHNNSHLLDKRPLVIQMRIQILKPRQSANELKEFRSVHKSVLKVCVNVLICHGHLTQKECLHDFVFCEVQRLKHRHERVT